MKYSFKLFHPNRYDQIFKEITEDSSLLNLNHNDIFQRMMKSFDGIPILTLTFDDRISGLPIYRITKKYPKLEDNLTSPKSYSYNENPPLGRANLKNIPVFYCSISKTTAISEMKDLLNEPYYISRWRLKFPKPTQINFLISNVIPDSTTIQGILAEILQKSINNLIKDIPEDKRKWFRYKLKIFNDLFTQKGDKYYYLSSAIAHHYIFDLKKEGAFVPILIYPSVTKTGKDINLAIDPVIADNPDFLEIESVIKSKISANDSGKFQGKFTSKAVFDSGELKWKKLKVVEYEIKTDQIQIKLESGMENHLVNPKNYNVTSNDFNGSLKEYIVKYNDFIKTNFYTNIGKIIEKHDIFDNNLIYTGELSVSIESDETVRINFKGNNHLHSLVISLKYTFEFN